MMYYTFDENKLCLLVIFNVTLGISSDGPFKAAHVNTRIRIFFFFSTFKGSKNFAVVTTSDQTFLTVLDLKKKEFSPLFRGFEPFKDQGKNTAILQGNIILIFFAKPIAM